VDIEDWRKKIDEVDVEMVRLLNRRLEYAIEIGKLKQRRQLTLVSPEREQEIITNALRHNQGPLDEAAIRRLFGGILEESRRIAQAMTVETGESKIEERE
jgi:chorismate mutase